MKEELFTGTVKEIAEKMQMKEETAVRGIIAVLVAKGIAKSAGVRPSQQKGGRGKGANLYSVPTTPITLTLFPV